MRKQFTAANQYSDEFLGGRFGFDIGFTIDAGSNSLTVEKEVAGVWYTYGAAITTTGTMRHYAANVDYTPGQRFRVKCGTFDTGPVYADVDGDIIGPEITQLNAGDAGRLTEDGDDRVVESGDYRILEDA